ncbi:hypothetical protein [Geochorda subterranea]|uniref:Uncharacterized protein n=1 Tax=Geochorda subterranea TaxID=3109564 RepID=A0ABZ1BTS1_9FIRM|nr:hypothetical protein [Limnochorda sp. LNt]WRP15568.1 hypothetical protein VLY81_05240 [Limnochorda sp. LNt]
MGDASHPELGVTARQAVNGPQAREPERMPAGVTAGATGGTLVMTAAEAAMRWAVAVAMPVIAVLLVVAAPRLTAVRLSTAPGLALTHAITLGLGSTMIVGAGSQMSEALLPCGGGPGRGSPVS